jgi:DNA-binding transcriptional LysR family regulator
MNINTIDLNLFLVFQAIYSTRSVTLAGQRLGMTQSAVSNALKRTRERFNDTLFIRTPEGMVPTPLAARLISPIELGLSHFNQAVDQNRHFSPDTSNRVFKIAISDIGQLVMMPRLLTAALHIAPNLKFETVDASILDTKHMMLHGEVDLAIGSWEGMGQMFYQQRLFDETFVVLMRKDHPIGPKKLTFDKYLQASHIAYRPRGATDTELQLTLNRSGVLDKRKVVLIAAHSLGLSSVVSSSNLILTAPQRLAEAMMSTRSDLRIEQTPFEVSPFQIRQQWHERFHQDSGNRWLRELIFNVFRTTSVAAESPDDRSTIEIGVVQGSTQDNASHSTALRMAASRFKVPAQNLQRLAAATI